MADNQLLTEQERRFNGARKSARSVIERTLGILKQRWYCLKSVLRFTPDKCCKVIVACVVLHNFATLRGEDIPEVFEVPEHERFEVGEDVGGGAMQARRARRQYIQQNFV